MAIIGLQLHKPTHPAPPVIVTLFPGDLLREGNAPARSVDRKRTLISRKGFSVKTAKSGPPRAAQIGDDLAMIAPGSDYSFPPGSDVLDLRSGMATVFGVEGVAPLARFRYHPEYGKRIKLRTHHLLTAARGTFFSVTHTLGPQSGHGTITVHNYSSAPIDVYYIYTGQKTPVAGGGTFTESY